MTAAESVCCLIGSFANLDDAHGRLNDAEPSRISIAVQEYWLDAWQRSVLFLDVLRERGNIYQEQSAKEVPHVLTFKAELVRDGRTLERPVNYALVRIVPPAGTQARSCQGADHRGGSARRPRPGHWRHEARQ